MDNKLKAIGRPIWIGLFLVIILALAGGYIWLTQYGLPEPTGERKKVTIAHGMTSGSALILIAFVEGYFSQEGLDVEMQPHTSGKAAVRSLLEGKADLANLGDIPMMFAVMSGKPIKLIATMNKTRKVLSVVARKDRGISTATDLKGKKIGATPGTGGHFFLYVLLSANGISRDEIEFVELKPTEIVEAISSGRVDAISSWQPHGVNSEAALGDNGVTFYGEEFHAETFNIAGMEPFIDGNLATVEMILRALAKAVDFIDRNPEKAIDDVATYANRNREQVAQVWGYYNFGLSLEQTLIVTLENESRWAIRNGLTESKQMPNYLDHISIDALSSVNPKAVTIIR